MDMWMWKWCCVGDSDTDTDTGLPDSSTANLSCTVNCKHKVIVFPNWPFFKELTDVSICFNFMSCHYQTDNNTLIFSIRTCG